MQNKDNFLLLDKSMLRKISVANITAELPDLKDTYESKAAVISNWLIDWIKESMKESLIKETDLLPKKAELAYYLGVSIGTIQNTFRILEDKGYVESKQRIGTMIKDWRKSSYGVRKLTSKRDISINLIKKYIIENKFKIGQKLPSTRILANIIGTSANTARLALEYLCSIHILEGNFRASNESNWIIKSTTFTIPKENAENFNNVTLVEKVEKDLEKYITKNLNVGDKLPAHYQLSEELKVSIKTIHDALKGLIKRKILLARRGRYGTTVIKKPTEPALAPKKETSIFSSASETFLYNYEKTQNHIKELIAQKYEIGSKLPSILELSKELDLSHNTVRKALNNLADEGYLRFSRGRYGGTFVIDVPEISSQSFKWLAVNPKYVEVYK